MKKIILLLATALLFTTCNRDPYYPFNQDAKEFFIFKKGSWWLYENEQTHERDCLYISEQDYIIKTEDYSPNHFYDRALTTFLSKDSVFYGNGTYYSSTDDTTRVSEVIYYKNIKFGFSLSFPFKDYERDYSFIKDSVTEVVHVKVQFSNINNIYSEMTRVFIKDGIVCDNILSQIWREKNIGMTKLYIQTDTSEFLLNLVDYNVIY